MDVPVSSTAYAAHCGRQQRMSGLEYLLVSPKTGVDEICHGKMFCTLKGEKRDWFGGSPQMGQTIGQIIDFGISI